jgi:branched-chain amino acid transport system ATP-binding protein
MSNMNDFALVCENIGMQFGGLAAVSNFALSISERALYGLIGPNGAGKTTVFNVISGVLSPTAGSVKLLGKDITGLNPDEIARRGIARTFQNIRLFRNLTVLENVLVGHHLRREATFGEALLAFPRYRKEESDMLRTSEELLEDVGLRLLFQ